jgi:hypothetical protein
MSEWELLDVMNSHMEMSQVSFNVYLTLVFGFLAASYLIAHRLSKFEILTITGLFVFGALIQAYSTVAHLIRQYQFAELARERLPELIGFHTKTVIVVVGILTATGIIASVYFMYDRTKRNNSR